MSTLPPIGSLVADKYRIEGLLGEGGMGAVFAARHELMDKPVALKWLKPQLAENAEARDRFLREAKAAARISHPNVVEVYDVGVHQGALFMVMERLEGQSFEDLLEQDNGLSIPQALQLLIGAMQGVQAAHDKGIIHRDIKPDNIFITHDPHRGVDIAKVLDFGISKLNEDAQGVGNFTRTGSVMGTPLYMSLEQINGSRDVDVRTDVYSFGVLLYRALTGHLPFYGDTLGMLAIKVATEDPRRAKELRSDLPTALDNIVMRAIARERDDRYSTMHELIDALSTLGSTEGFLGQMTHRAITPPQLTPKTPMPAAHISSTTAHSETVGSTNDATTQTAFAVGSNSVRPAGLPNKGTLRLIGVAFLLLIIGGGAWVVWGGAEQSAGPIADHERHGATPSPIAGAPESKPALETEPKQAATSLALPEPETPAPAIAEPASPKPNDESSSAPSKSSSTAKNKPTKRKQAKVATPSATATVAPVPAPSPQAPRATPKPKATQETPRKSNLRSGKQLTTSDF